MRTTWRTNAGATALVGHGLASPLVHAAVKRALYRFFFGATVTALALQASAAFPEDLWSYVSKHSSVVSGTLASNAGCQAFEVCPIKQSEFVSLRVVDRFDIGSGFSGVARLDLFSRTRDAEVPASDSDAALIGSAYSSGEVSFSLLRKVATTSSGAVVEVECMGGFDFAMTGVGGSVGAPEDGTKVLAGCGPRYQSGDGSVSVILGHFGPVVDSAKLLGFTPSLMIHGYFPLKFMGDGFAFAPDVLIGSRQVADGRALTKSFRLGISKRFKAKE